MTEVFEVEAGDVSSRLCPLVLYMEGCATQQEMNANVLATIERGYVRFNEFIDQYHGRISIVGSGPSLDQTYTDLAGDILAINHALKFLLEQNIIPKFAMIWDADPICEQFAIPHKDITYLIGARCHPKVFERLQGCQVIVWHAGGDHNINDFLLEHNIQEPMINGGSAGITRAMYLAVALGYKDLHLYGADSSYSADGKTHVNGSLVKEKDFMVSIGKDQPVFFRTTPEWCSQVNEFRDIYSIFRHPNCDIAITTHGDGMLPYMASLMKKKDEEGLLWMKDGQPHPSNVATQYSQPLEEIEHANASE